MTRRVRTMTDPSILAIADFPTSGDGRLSLWRTGPQGMRFDRITSGSASSLASTLDASLAGRLIINLPSGQVRCRVCELPDAGEEQLAMALRLQAESVQLGGVPAHRCASAVFPRQAGADGRCGIILEWPVSEALPSIPGSFTAQRSPGFAGDVSALAGLASVAGVRGPLLVIDTVNGIVAFALVTPKGFAVRSAREDLSGDAVGAVTRLLLETALHHGMDGAALEQLATDTREAMVTAGSAGFGCTAADRARLVSATGAPAEIAWWRSNALHAGSALAANGPLAALVRLSAHEPGEEPDALGRVINRLASPEGLGWAVVAAIIAIAFGPLAISWSDYQIMQWKVGSVGADKMRAVVAENDRMLALYRERALRTWPLSKILSDLASCTPEGIELDQINIVHGESVSVRGQARKHDQLSAPEVVLRMERLLQESRIFSKINKGWEPPNQMGVLQFNLSATVTAPTRPIALAEGQDWAELTLAERRYPSLRRSKESDSATADGSQTNSDQADGASGAGAVVAGTPSEPAVGASNTEGDGTQLASATGGRRSPAAAPPAGVGGVVIPEDNTFPSGTGGAPDAAVANAPEGDTATPGADGGRRPVQAAGSEAARRGLQMTGAPSGGGAERGARAGPAAATPDVPPDPFTDEQINAMSKEEALAAASTVAKARNNKAFDETIQTRLKDDFYKLMARVRAAPQ